MRYGLLVVLGALWVWSAIAGGPDRVGHVVAWEEVVPDQACVWVADPAVEGGCVCAPAAQASSLPRPDGASLVGLGEPLDLNAASVSDLAAVPGLGDRMAKRIVLDREASGPFCSVDMLARVKGLGERRIASVRGFLFARCADGQGK